LGTYPPVDTQLIPRSLFQSPPVQRTRRLFLVRAAA